MKTYTQAVIKGLGKWSRDPETLEHLSRQVKEHKWGPDEVEERMRTSLMKEARGVQNTDPGSVDTRGLGDKEVESLVQSGYEEV